MASPGRLQHCAPTKIIISQSCMACIPYMVYLSYTIHVILMNKNVTPARDRAIDDFAWQNPGIVLTSIISRSCKAPETLIGRNPRAPSLP